MGIPDCSCSKGGEEPGMKDAMDVILTAKIRPEHPVGPAFGKDLIKEYVFLDGDIGAHAESTYDCFFTGPTYEHC
jgi:hypothetical protein